MTCACGAVAADDECQYPCNDPRGDPMTTPADTLKTTAREYRAAQGEMEYRRRDLAQAVRDAIEGGMSQSEASRIVGVDRLTIRKWISA